MRLRPAPLLIGGLALTGVLKAATVFMAAAPDHAPGAPLPRLAGAAEAAGAPAKPAPAPEPQPVAAAEPEQCPVPEELLRALDEERELIAADRAALEQRRAEIELAEEQLAIEQARLTETKQALEDLLARVEAAKTEDVARLVSLYKNMKPKEAAGIMDDIDLEVAVMVLGSMAERDAAPILANLNVVRARAISKIILERSKLPGDQKLDGIKLN